jgi:hypothetical protein
MHVLVKAANLLMPFELGVLCMQATSCSSDDWEHLSPQPSQSSIEAVAEQVRGQLVC